jgi:hypothetical protein
VPLRILPPGCWGQVQAVGVHCEAEEADGVHERKVGGEAERAGEIRW